MGDGVKISASSGFPGTLPGNPETQGVFRRLAQNRKTRKVGTGHRRVRVFLSAPFLYTLRREDPHATLSELLRNRLHAALSEPAADLSLGVLRELRSQLRALNEHTRLAHIATHTPPQNLLALLAGLERLIPSIPASPATAAPEGPFDQAVDVRLSGDLLAAVEEVSSQDPHSLSCLLRLLIQCGRPLAPNAQDALAALRRTSPNIHQLRDLIAKGAISPGADLLAALGRLEHLVAGYYRQTKRR